MRFLGLATAVVLASALVAPAAHAQVERHPPTGTASPLPRILGTELYPARTFRSDFRMDVWAILPDGKRIELGTVGHTTIPRWFVPPAGSAVTSVAVPECVMWGVHPGEQRLGDALLAEIVAVMKAERVPGLSLRRSQGGGCIVLDDFPGDVSAAGYAALAGANDLRWLDLQGTEIDDAGLEHVSRLKNLRWLGLWSCGKAVTDRGMKSVAAMEGLRALEISGSAVTSTGLRRVATLKELQDLAFYSATDSDAAMLEAIGEIRTLTRLDIRINGSRDGALVPLAKLTALESLNLDSMPGITVGNLAVIASLPRLKQLTIMANGMDDARIAALAKSTSLQEITIDWLSKDAVDRLAAAMPRCKVRYNRRIP